MPKSKIITSLDDFEAALAREMAQVEADPAGYVEAQRPPAVGNPITLGPLVMDAAEWSKKQVDRAKAGADLWLEHSKRPRKVPSKAALEANAKRIEKLQKSLADKTWEGAMAHVDEDLRILTIEKKGARGFSDGIDVHSAKVDKVVGTLQPQVLALKKTLDGMPQDTDAQREAKMIAAKRGMQAIGLARKK